MTTPVEEGSNEEPIIEIVSEDWIDPEYFMLLGIDTTEGPRFTVSEVARVFFARSAHWVRWRQQRSYFVLCGDLSCPHEEIQLGGLSGTRKVPVTWIEGEHCTHCNGKAVGTRLTKAGARSYALQDVEEMAHALAQRGAINGSQLRNTLMILRAVSENHGYL